MRIAFVGKGGAGKTTLSALFSDYVSKVCDTNIFLVDADMNMHVGGLLGFPDFDKEKHLSQKEVTEEIKKHVWAQNKRVGSSRHIKKTLPPTENSGFFDLSDKDNLIFKNFCQNKDSVFLSVVGSYEKEGIGKSCYHNNLAILEILLSHSVDKDEIIITDMVAGIDAFAGSLHAHFDALVLSVEPTARSVAVYRQYEELAQAAGVIDHLFVIGNKISDASDEEYISEHIPKDKLLGFLYIDDHLRNVDRGSEFISYEKLDSRNKEVFAVILKKLQESQTTFNKRLERIVKLHKEYSGQEHIQNSLGDLSSQVQEDFDFDKYVASLST